MKKMYVSPASEVIEMQIDSPILGGSGSKLNINSDETVTGSDAMSSHRSGAFPWSEEE